MHRSSLLMRLVKGRCMSRVSLPRRTQYWNNNTDRNFQRFRVSPLTPKRSNAEQFMLATCLTQQKYILVGGKIRIEVQTDQWRSIFQPICMSNMSDHLHSFSSEFNTVFVPSNCCMRSAGDSYIRNGRVVIAMDVPSSTNSNDVAHWGKIRIFMFHLILLWLSSIM